MQFFFILCFLITHQVTITLNLPQLTTKELYFYFYIKKKEKRYNMSSEALVPFSIIEIPIRLYTLSWTSGWTAKILDVIHPSFLLGMGLMV